MTRLMCCLMGGLLAFTSFTYNAVATSWAYPFVVWEDYIYVLTEEAVTDIGEGIGKVTAFSDMQQLPGNFSNELGAGTNYYSIINISTDEAIAVEVENGVFHKAERKEKYGAAEPAVHGDNSSPIVLVVVVGLLSFGFIISLKYVRGIREN
ncbi:hypothetical protein V1502_12060 [Bacillus sp. SCS-153A]|uniref:hypothetical protein n=1 Tax=Rossellomorea sedimentorum TaxID=3115294 RepID=UPI00390616F1